MLNCRTLTIDEGISGIIQQTKIINLQYERKGENSMGR